jgi:hypothetical protein
MICFAALDQTWELEVFGYEQGEYDRVGACQDSGQAQGVAGG